MSTVERDSRRLNVILTETVMVAGHAVLLSVEVRDVLGYADRQPQLDDLNLQTDPENKDITKRKRPCIPQVMICCC